MTRESREAEIALFEIVYDEYMRVDTWQPVSPSSRRDKSIIHKHRRTAINSVFETVLSCTRRHRLRRTV